MKLCFQAAVAGKTSLIFRASIYGGGGRRIILVLEILLFFRRQAVDFPFQPHMCKTQALTEDAASNYCLKCFKQNWDGSFSFESLTEDCQMTEPNTHLFVL